VALARAVTEPAVGPALVDGVFVATVLGLAAPVALRLPPRGRVLLAAWLLTIAALALAGAFFRAGMVAPWFAGVVSLSTAAGVAFVCSRSGAALLRRTPAAWLVGLQSFRVIVELVLWALALQGRAPLLLTFEGRNADILVGLTALPVAWLCFVRRAWPPWTAAAWNVAGIVILSNVVVHALLSAPTPFRLIETAPPTTIIATLPYVWLPGFLVPLAFSLHVASLRTLGAARAPVKETR
jgi:hypothetical protein